MSVEPEHVVYTGHPEKAGGPCKVVVVGNGDPYDLDPRFDIERRSPTGFQWGHGGSGPAQLALALLADATGNDDLAYRYHQSLKWDVISRVPQKRGWSFTRRYILDWLARRQKRPMLASPSAHR